MKLQDFVARLNDSTSDEVEDAIDSLIDKGLLVPVMDKNGDISYDLTEQGKMIARHLDQKTKFSN